MESSRRSSSPGPRLNSPNADFEIRNHDLDLLNQSNTFDDAGAGDTGSHNVPTVKTWVKGTLLGSPQGLKVNELNESSLESTGPIDVSMIADEFGSSIDSLTSDSNTSVS